MASRQAGEASPLIRVAKADPLILIVQDSRRARSTGAMIQVSPILANREGCSTAIRRSRVNVAASIWLKR